MKFTFATFVIFTGAVTSVSGAPVEYVRVCDTYGVRFFYIPGTDVCVDAVTGETRQATPDGTILGKIDLAQRAQDAQILADKAIEGSAIALTVPNAQIAPGKTFAAAVNAGGVGGKAALGGSFAMEAAEGLTLNGGVGLGLQYGTVGAKGGVNFSW